VESDRERIKTIVAETSERYRARNGAVMFAGLDGNTVRIAPAGFCWQ
jgi:hypothetical protein